MRHDREDTTAQEEALRSTRTEAAQVLAEGEGRSRFVWTVDVLPDALAPYVEDMMARGAAAMKEALEAAATEA